MEILRPPGWPRPAGYSDGVAARGRLLFVAGQVGRAPGGGAFADGLVAQARQAFANILAVLAAGGGEARHVVRLTWFVRDRAEYLAHRDALGGAYRAAFGTHFPAMTLVQVAALVDDEARLEIEATAVIPDEE